MDYRGINKWLVFPKPLHRANKSLSLSLLGSDVCILAAVVYGYNTIISIRGYLKGFHRTYSFDFISNKLKNMQSLGLVDNVRGKWSLTIAGRNALNSLEKLVRECRYDK